MDAQLTGRERVRDRPEVRRQLVLRALLEEKGWTRGQLAEASGLPLQSVNNWYRGDEGADRGQPVQALLGDRVTCERFAKVAIEGSGKPAHPGPARGRGRPPVEEEDEATARKKPAAKPAAGKPKHKN
jgi:transcriptional regulator with XRE-family HTH domain